MAVIFYAQLCNNKTTIQGQFTLITYILKSDKKQKGKPRKTDFPFVKKDITNNLGC